MTTLFDIEDVLDYTVADLINETKEWIEIEENITGVTKNVLQREVPYDLSINDMVGEAYRLASIYQEGLLAHSKWEKEHTSMEHPEDEYWPSLNKRMNYLLGRVGMLYGMIEGATRGAGLAVDNEILIPKEDPPVIHMEEILDDLEVAFAMLGLEEDLVETSESLGEYGPSKVRRIKKLTENTLLPPRGIIEYARTDYTEENWMDMVIRKLDNPEEVGIFA